MNSNKFKAKLAVVFLCLLSVSCKNKTENNHEASHDHNHGGHHGSHTSERSTDQQIRPEPIILTDSQVKSIGVNFGTFSQVKATDFIKVTGLLSVPPTHLTSISPKIEGVIKINQAIVEGDYIKKGTQIAYLYNPELLEKQQAYLELQHELSYLSSQYERQKSLFEQNAGVEKAFQQAKSRYLSVKTKHKSLEKYLSYLGIDSSKLTISSMRDHVVIRAPVSGYLSKLIIHNGMYVRPTNSLFDIIDVSHQHLELDVFENDVLKLKLNQRVSYTVLSDDRVIYQARVSKIGKSYLNDAKVIRVHAHLEGKKPPFINELFVNAKVWLSDQTVSALPEEAIIKDQHNYIIYVAKPHSSHSEVEFVPLMVKKGKEVNGYVAVKLIDPLPSGMKIVTRGAYYVYAQSKAGTLHHEH